MGNRNGKFKNGVDWGEEGLKPTTDLNPTLNEIIDFAGGGMAEGQYRVLQSNNVYTNGDHFVVDEFTDATGTNNTVNTGSTNANYEITDKLYYLTYTDAVNIDDNTEVNVLGDNSKTLVKTISSVNKIISKHDYEIWGHHYGGGSAGHDYKIYSKFYYSDSTSEEVSETFVFTTSTDDVWTTGSVDNPQLYKKVSYVEIYLEIDYSISPEEMKTRNNSLDVQDFDSTSSVVCDTNTKTLDGTEESVLVYGDKTNTSNTNITVDISDGTTTLSSQPLNEVIALTGFTSGTLELTFNLTTTDSSETPTIGGFSSYIR